MFVIGWLLVSSWVKWFLVIGVSKLTSFLGKLCGRTVQANGTLFGGTPD